MRSELKWVTKFEINIANSEKPGHDPGFPP